MMGATAPINAAINFQFIQAAGVAGFVSGVQAGTILPAQAIAEFRAVGQAIDRYVGVHPLNDSPTALRASIRDLPERDIEPEMQERVLGLLTTDRAVVEKAVRIYEINAGAPFDLPAEWRWIPAGEFRMGSASDDQYRYDDEKFQETVITGGLFMLDHPATNAEFLTFLKAVGREDIRGLGQKFAGDLQPAIRVIHEEATAYSRWLGERVAESMGVPLIGRLPTEEEWEKAAKGPDGNEFISPATSKQAHFDAETTRAIDHPGVFANGYGLKDMIGNVWEWTSSPLGEASSRFVLRGGSWDDDVPGYLRAAYRGSYHLDDRSYIIGFRPVVVPQDSLM